MKKTFTLFDYIYYRFNNFYKKWDGEHAITVIIAVSALQFNIIFIFYVIVTKFFIDLDKIHSVIYTNIVVAILMILLLIINHFKYKEKSHIFHEKWKNESKKMRVINGIGIVLILLLSYLPVVHFKLYLL